MGTVQDFNWQGSENAIHCIKTRTTYEAQLAAWQKQQETIRSLEAALGGGSSDPGGQQQVQAQQEPQQAQAQQEPQQADQQQAQQEPQQAQQAAGAKRQGGEVVDLTGDSPAAKKLRL